MIMRCLLNYYLSSKDAERFGNWAWGEEFERLSLDTKCMKIWNERHGDKLTLKLGSRVSEDIEKMIKIWRENDQNTQT
jgi:hypothetical protein